MSFVKPEKRDNCGKTVTAHKESKLNENNISDSYVYRFVEC